MKMMKTLKIFESRNILKSQIKELINGKPLSWMLYKIACNNFAEAKTINAELIKDTEYYCYEITDTFQEIHLT